MGADTQPTPQDRQGMRRAAPALAFGALLTIAAAIFFAVAFSIPIREADQLLGPRLFPLAITGALVVLGAIYTVSIFLSRDAVPATAEDGFRWQSAALIMGGVLLFALLVNPAGFILAETALFVTVARAFRSRNPIKDTVIGFVLALVIFVVFTQGLGLRLPAGPFAHIARLWS